MTRLRRIAIGLASLACLVLVAAILVVRTDWFRNYVREKIIVATEDALGGKVELESFSFDWRRLRAEVTNFVIHGNEPAGAAPFFRTSRVRLDLSLFTSLSRMLNVEALEVSEPQVNIVTLEDGSLNIPRAKKASTSDTTPLETIVDLAVGRFNLSRGTIHYNERTRPLDVQGENLRATLAFNVLTRSYEGQLTLQPVYVVQGRQTPVVVSVALPMVLERDRILLKDATVSTPLSKLKFTVSLANLKQPQIEVRLEGGIAVADLNRLGDLSLDESANILIDADARVAGDLININKLHAEVGNSRIDVSGPVQGSLSFRSNLDLAELAKFAKSRQKISGQATADGTVRFVGKQVELQSIRVRAFGGEVSGEGRLENFAQYQAKARLKGMKLQAVQQRLGWKPLPYDGTVTGVFEVEGNFDEPRGGVAAKVNFHIAPGRSGVPLSGRIEAEYKAADGLVRARPSYLALPHTRLNFAGSLGNGLKLDLSSNDLRDLFAALPGAPPPAKLNGGKLDVVATVTGSTDDPRLAGRASVTRIAVQDRQFDSIAADFSAFKNRFVFQNGTLSRGPMQGSFSGTVGLANWSPTPDRPISLNAAVRNGDLADVLALAGQPSDGYSGALTATVGVSGSIGNPTGTATVSVTNGTLADEPFDTLHLRSLLGDGLVRIPEAFIARDQSRIDLTAEFTHPKNSFRMGHIQAHVVGSQVEVRRRSRLTGTLQADVSVEGDLTQAQEFRLTSVAGDLSAKGVRLDGESFGDVTAKASTAGNTVSYNLTSNFAGSQIRAKGHTELKENYPTNVDANLNDLPIERALAAAKRRDIPARGLASGTLHFAGTVKDPQGELDLDVRNAVLYDEPVDRLRVRAVAQPTSLEVTRLEATAGPSQLALTARFDHPRTKFDQGTLAFQIKSSRLNLERIRIVQLHRPGLAGALEVSGGGKSVIHASGPNRFAVDGLNARIAATGLRAADRDLGNLEVTVTGAGDRVNAELDSNLAKAVIRGRGNASLSGDFPLSAELTFDELGWANLQPLLSGGAQSPLDGTTSGRVTLNGPIKNVDQLNASLRLTKLQVRSVQSQSLALQNQGDIVVSMQKGQVRVESAHITGQETDITLSGTGSSRGQKLDLRLNAKSSLALLRAFSPDIYSTGIVTATAVIQGNIQKPVVNGKLELQKASISAGDLPVGLSNANGVIAFNGSTATIRALTGEAGGGKVTVSGFVSYADSLRFALKADAAAVRVRVQQGVSAVLHANISLAGTTQSSLASGTVTIDRLTYLPQTDIVSILTRSAPPVQSSAGASPLLQNLRLDILVRTSAAPSIQASLAQNLQISADLRVRGRASQPGVTGSIQMNHGELAFFGSTYRLSSGSISFYNPNRVEPILNITLETNAKGVTVVLSVTGPIDNMKLAYTSDPPLQFEEIVALLAAGKPPTSDPTLLANQPAQPPQTFQQRGESALVSKALADPLANRLQRVFGVSQLKIDPSFTSGSQLPQARVTLQQQVASNLLFTYVTALDNPNTQIVRIEWSMNSHWSAAANRDENGMVSLNLLYKKQFR